MIQVYIQRLAVLHAGVGTFCLVRQSGLNTYIIYEIYSSSLAALCLTGLLSVWGQSQGHLTCGWNILEMDHQSIAMHTFTTNRKFRLARLLTGMFGHKVLRFSEQHTLFCRVNLAKASMALRGFFTLDPAALASFCKHASQHCL